jgi:hypothetical protein
MSPSHHLLPPPPTFTNHTHLQKKKKKKELSEMVDAVKEVLDMRLDRADEEERQLLHLSLRDAEERSKGLKEKAERTRDEIENAKRARALRIAPSRARVAVNRMLHAVSERIPCVDDLAHQMFTLVAELPPVPEEDEAGSDASMDEEGYQDWRSEEENEYEFWYPPEMSESDEEDDKDDEEKETEDEQPDAMQED